jgi:hypothetical protein
MRQISPVHTPFHLMKNHLYIILPFTPVSSNGTHFLRFSHQNPLYTSNLSHSRYMPSPFQFVEFITCKTLDKDYISLSSSLCSLTF